LAEVIRALGVCVWVLVAVSAGAEETAPETFHPQHPPAGVSAAHTIHAGKFAAGYAYQYSRFDELRNRRDRTRATALLATTGYTSAPSRVEVERHDVALMYAPHERVTLMATLPILRKEMVNESAAGAFTTRASGIGDLTLTAIGRFMTRDFEQTFVHLTLGTPTGSIRKSDNTPFGRERLPYPMQLGSGVWHLEPGLSYQGQRWRYTWGGQARTLFRMGKNDVGYRPGNEYRITGWLGRQWLDGLATSLRLEWQRWENTRGADPRLDPDSTPVADPLAQKGVRLDVGFGLDVRLPFLKSQRFEVEATLPIWEWLDGPQPSFDWRVRAGWRWAI
jgi:hypothetical protein